MRKGMWSAAAFILLLSGAPVLWGPDVQAADNRVAMVDLAFEPADIQVPVNTPVVFHNDGSIQHDAKAENNSFATPLLDPGKEHSVTVVGAPGDVIPYFCTVEGHKSAGMKGVIRVVAAGSTPSAPATTPTTAATTTTTTKPVPGQPATTTTTAKVAAGSASTTTTAPAANGTTTTTLAPAVTPTSGPETAGETTTTTTAGQGGEESAAADHGSGGDSEKKKEKNSPIGIAFASLATVLLAAISGKLLASKS
jgi:plastocyanin